MDKARLCARTDGDTKGLLRMVPFPRVRSSTNPEPSGTRVNGREASIAGWARGSARAGMCIQAGLRRAASFEGTVTYPDGTVRKFFFSNGLNYFINPGGQNKKE